MNEKTIVITGATSGIGLAAAIQLCQRGERVIGMGSSVASCEKAINLVKSDYPDAKISYIDCDLSSLACIRAATERIKSEINDGPLDVFAHNAGVFTRWYQTSVDGIEMQFAVNYLSGFLLSHLLLSNLQRSPEGRIITTTSGSHNHTHLNFSDLQLSRHYHCLWAYKCTKLENVLYSYEWNRHFASSGVRAYAADPGLVNTDMGQKHTSGLIAWFWNKRKKSGISPMQGAQTLVHLASNSLSGESEQVYFRDCGPYKHDTYSQREDVAKQLWEISAKLCSINIGTI